MRISRGLLVAFFSACLFSIPASVYTATIQVSWLSNTDSDLAGYIVYCGTSSGTYATSYDAGASTTFLLTGAQSGTTYYIAVAAYDTSRNVSLLSAERSVSVPATSSSTTTTTSSAGIVPLTPAMNATVYSNPVLTWSGSGYTNYRVYVSTNGNKYSRIYMGSGKSCKMQDSLWTLFIPSGTTISWYVQGFTSAGKTTQSAVMKFKKG